MNHWGNENRRDRIIRFFLDKKLGGQIPDDILDNVLSISNSDNPDQNKVKLFGQYFDGEINTGNFIKRWYGIIDPVEWVNQVSLKLFKVIDSIPSPISKSIKEFLCTPSSQRNSDQFAILDGFLKNQIDNNGLVKAWEKYGDKGKDQASVINPFPSLDGMKFVLIKADKNIKKDFYLQTTPVTVDQWRVFSHTGYKTKAEDEGWSYVLSVSLLRKEWDRVRYINWDTPGFNKSGKHPATCFCREDITAFIDWLSKQSDHKIRLPSEMEWEYACRAGSVFDYCYGNDPGMLGEYAWYNKNSDFKTHDVGGKKSNDWGLYDMHGNVWEICDTDGKIGLKGGSWLYGSTNCTSGFVLTGKERTNDAGFRLLIEK